MTKEYEVLKDRCALKAVKFSAFATEETHCYKANLYFDEHLIAEVSNSGHGGCDRQHVKWGKGWERLVNSLKALKPYEKCKRDDGSSFELRYDVEHVCGDIMNEWLLNKDIKRVMKKDRIVFLPTGKFNGDLSYFRYNQTDESRRRIFIRIHKEHPHAEILTGRSMDYLREVWKS